MFGVLLFFTVATVVVFWSAKDCVSRYPNYDFNNNMAPLRYAMPLIITGISLLFSLIMLFDFFWNPGHNDSVVGSFVYFFIGVFSSLAAYAYFRAVVIIFSKNV